MGDEVLKNGEICRPVVRRSVDPSVRPSVRPSVCPSVRPAVRPSICPFPFWAIQPGLRPSQPGLKPEAWLVGCLCLRPGWLGLRPGRLGLRPSWIAQRGERTDKHFFLQTSQKSILLITVLPLSIFFQLCVKIYLPGTSEPYFETE